MDDRFKQDIDALASRARFGDRRAADELFRVIDDRAGATLQAIAEGFLRDEMEAEDVVQDTLVRLFRNLSRIPPERSCWLWVVTVLKNRLIDKLRSRNAESRALCILGDDLPDGKVTPERQEIRNRNAARNTAQRSVYYRPLEVLPDGDLLRQEQRSVLARAISLLRRTDRHAAEVFFLREFLDQRIDQVAVRLRVSESTVKLRHWRAKRILRSGLPLEYSGSLFVSLLTRRGTKKPNERDKSAG